VTLRLTRHRQRQAAVNRQTSSLIVGQPQALALKLLARLLGSSAAPTRSRAVAPAYFRRVGTIMRRQ
jgi:hypothetical protein